MDNNTPSVSRSQTPLELATAYKQRGFAPLPVPYKEKAPRLKEWQNAVIPKERLSDFFNGQPQNIGVLLGEPSGGLIDIDLDCDEARKLAAEFLPSTSAVFGKTSTPRSHYLYRCAGLKSAVFQDVDGSVLLEIRADGRQTIFPGSTHPNGDAIRWDSDGETAVVEPERFRAVVSLLAAASLLAKHWPEKGGRHAAALALAGGLLRSGMNQDEAEDFIEAVASAAGDEEIADRIGCVKATAAKLENGEECTGWKTLSEFVGEKAVSKAMQYFAVKINEGPVSETVSNVEGLPAIEIEHRYRRDITTEALASLRSGTGPQLYSRGGGIARIARDDHGVLYIHEVLRPELASIMERAANYGTMTPRGFIPRPVPAGVVEDTLVMAPSSFRVIRGITEVPILRDDGTVLSVAGYDPASGLYYEPDPTTIIPAIPSQPTQAEAMSAAHYICGELLADFPFVDAHSRANMLALLLNPLIRPYIKGATPLHLIDAPDAGTGKSLLCELVGIIATGRETPMTTLPVREEEVKKTLFSLLIAGAPIIALDNQDGELRSATLASYLTSAVIVDRVLGFSRSERLPQRATWIATGNNLKVGGDIPRRGLLIRIDAKMPNPWRREAGKFKHPNLKEWAKQHRGELVAALLTMARAWCANGCPAAKVPAMGSFEDWGCAMAGILEYCDVPGFLGNASDFHSRIESDSGQWRAFLAAAHVASGGSAVTVKELCQLLDAADEHWLDLLPDVLQGQAEKGRSALTRSLGKALGSIADRRFSDDGLRLTSAGIHTRNNVKLWRIQLDK